MKDGINSGIRYVKNNFFDGDRQDAMDLFLGKYRVEGGEGVNRPCPFKGKPSSLFRPVTGRG